MNSLTTLLITIVTLSQITLMVCISQILLMIIGVSELVAPCLLKYWSITRVSCTMLIKLSDYQRITRVRCAMFIRLLSLLERYKS
jgi:hypothetical protein